MKDAYERRALLLHLGDVLEAIQSVLHCGRKPGQAMHELVVAHDSLARFPFLTQISAQMPVQDFVERATGAFAGWPRALLEEDLNRVQLARAVRRSLFAGNPAGWRAYVAMLRSEVAWFGKGVSPGEGEHEAVVETAAGDDESGRDAAESDVEAPGGDALSRAGDVERGDVEQRSTSRQGVENVESAERVGRLYPAWPWKA